MIIPALDLIDGTVVRLYQGDYQKRKNYNYDPISILNSYLKQGARILHLVDLNGARNPQTKQTALLINLLNKISPALVQVGGGIRTLEDIDVLLNAGATRIVIGSTAVLHTQKVSRWFKTFGPDALVLALDVRINNAKKYMIAINGWQQKSDVTLEQVIKQYHPLGLKHVLCTDISRDGTLAGSNIPLYCSLCDTWPNIAFQSSGGIGSLNDISNLRHSGVNSVIVGRALLENQFTLTEALECWQNA